jgi:UDP-N-acetyl-D-glucosamine dehydrogenase
MRLLEERGAKVEYHDPYIPEVRDHGHGEPSAKSVELTDERVRAADCVIITTDHTSFDYARIVRDAKLVVDTRNATRKLGKPANVVKL